MKSFVVGSVLLLASACAGYVPADTPEVAAAKAAHFAAHAAAGVHGHGHGAAHWDHHDTPKWHGPLHYPVIHKGVPVETPEVQHAKAFHASAHAKAHSGAGYAPAHGHYDDHHHGAAAPVAHHGHSSGGAWHGPQHVPVIHNGVPVETPEVQHAKAAHLHALASAGSHGGHSAGGHWGASGHEDDGSYKPQWEHHNY